MIKWDAISIHRLAVLAAESSCMRRCLCIYSGLCLTGSLAPGLKVTANSVTVWYESKVVSEVRK